ncbi:MAG TPA: hypothetical protein VFW94_05750 [Candidatus Acidoferrales bacterium]|nr:hypothetical protein [Candidatus Acidoferrales bacterium]
MPLAALSSAAKSKTTRATMDLLADASVAGTQVKAGTYDVVANESTLKMTHNGKVVAQAPIEWRDEQSKQQRSSIVAESGRIIEVHFGGKTRYAQIANGSTGTAAGQE